MPAIPDVIASRTLRERVGGRWAISRLTYAITAVLGLLSVLAGQETGTQSVASAVRWTALWLVASIIVGLLLMLLDVTAFRRRRTHPVPIWLVVMKDVTVAVTFTTCIWVGAPVFGLTISRDLVELLVINALYAVWWGMTLSYYLDYREQLASIRRTLIDEGVRIEMTRLEQTDLIEQIRHDIVDEVGSELGPARERVEAMIAELSDGNPDTARPEPEDWHDLSQLLRDTASESVRPLSRRLWRPTESQPPDLPWWALPANIVRFQPLRPLAFAVVDVLGTTAADVSLFGVRHGLLILACGLAISITVILLANVLMRRHPGHHATIFLTAIVVMQLAVVVRSALREFFIPGSAPVTWQVTQVIAGIIVILVTSGFGARRDKQAEMMTNLQEYIQADHVASIARAQQIALLTREAAQHLHGSVQSRLMAAAMAIDDASEREDDEALAMAITATHQAFASLDHSPTRSASITEEVHRKIALWEGFCDFDVSVRGNIDQPDAKTSETVGKVIEEAVTNALRHGQATRISVSVDADQANVVRVHVDDDGIGPQGGAPGLGSAYLQQATQGRWSLVASETGSHFEAAISPSPH